MKAMKGDEGVRDTGGGKNPFVIVKEMLLRRASPPGATKGGSFMKEDVQKIINDIRPSLQADGGDVELVDVSPDGIVSVRLVGACAGCPMSQMTLKGGIEKYLKKMIPGVKSVIAVP